MEACIWLCFVFPFIQTSILRFGLSARAGSNEKSAISPMPCSQGFLVILFCGSNLNCPIYTGQMKHKPHMDQTSYLLRFVWKHQWQSRSIREPASCAGTASWPESSLRNQPNCRMKQSKQEPITFLSRQPVLKLIEALRGRAASSSWGPGQILERWTSSQQWSGSVAWQAVCILEWPFIPAMPFWNNNAKWVCAKLG